MRDFDDFANDNSSYEFLLARAMVGVVIQIVCNKSKRFHLSTDMGDLLLDAVVCHLLIVHSVALIEAAGRQGLQLLYRAAHPYAGVERHQLPNVKVFGDDYPDANARDDFRFTVAELKMLAEKLNIPDEFKTPSRDV